jgi:hypothetical protein
MGSRELCLFRWLEVIIDIVKISFDIDSIHPIPNYKAGLLIIPIISVSFALTYKTVSACGQRSADSGVKHSKNRLLLVLSSIVIHKWKD